MVIVGAVALVLILIVGIILPLNASVAKAQDRVARKQADLAWMQGAEIPGAWTLWVRRSLGPSLPGARTPGSRCPGDDL